MEIRATTRLICRVVVCLALSAAGIAATENKTVIGPSNPDLQEGANALLAGDAQEGVSLTLRGLEYAGSRRERVTAWSNLCAGYAMLEEYTNALTYCDLALGENSEHWRALNNRALVYVKIKRYSEAATDLDKAESLAPKSRTIKVVRALLNDAVNPVSPSIVIDDRRNPDVGDDSD